MGLTASQIRQDLNCFGGFGQQGYGYNVEYLYTNICELLGVDRNFKAVIVGAGNLGKALVRSPMFEKRGVDVVAMFDVSNAIVGKKIGNVRVYDLKEMESRLSDFDVDIVILTLPKEYARDISARLAKTEIRGIWNFTGKELELKGSGIMVENVHLGDSLMTLCYDVAKSVDEKRKKEN
jgi:redox-sensing transcriptional repressor